MAMGWWNAHVYVGSAKVGLGWTVTDDPNPRAKHLDYKTEITVTYPQQATASVQREAANETVNLIASPSLPCGSDGIALIVTYRVTPKVPGTGGSHVAVKVARVSGVPPRTTTHIWAKGNGQIGQLITVNVVIPGSC